MQFSVIIPVHNGSSYIARAIDSVLSQKETSVEIIVVDDGSTDKSAEIAASIDPAVKVIQTANRGPSFARNTGIHAASGEIIAFLDADDQWLPNKLSSQARIFKSDPEIALVFTDYRGIDQEGHDCGWQGGLQNQLHKLNLFLSPITSDGFRLDGSVFHALIIKTSFMHMSSVAVRRTVFNKTGYFNETMGHGEDLDLWIRIAYKSSVGYIDKIACIVEQRNNSQGRNYTKMDEQLVMLYTSLINNYDNLPKYIRCHIAKFIASRHLSLGWRYREAGDMRKSRYHYFQSFAKCLSARALLGYAKTLIYDSIRIR